MPRKQRKRLAPIHPGEVLQTEFLEPLEMTPRFFGTSELFWLNLQAAFDLDIERDRLGSRLAREVGVLAKAS
jgi:plasmid maintenance system antidote protein VapI